MYKLIYEINETKDDFYSNSFDEIMSIAVDIFNKNGDLIEIQENGKSVLKYCEIYDVIERVRY